MVPSHPLSIGLQVLDVLLVLAFGLHLAHSLSALRAHMRSPRVAAQPSLLACSALHLPLSTCIRLVVVAMAVCGIGGVSAAIAAFIRVPAADAGLRFVSLTDPAYPFTAAGRACIAFAKLGPVAYVAFKALSYVFFFLKARSVRPLVRLSPLEKVAGAATLAMFGVCGTSLWLIGGDRSAIDGQCQFHVPMGFAAVMLACDVAISGLYLYLFIAPLRETIAATRSMTVHHAQQTTVPAAAAAHESVCESHKCSKEHRHTSEQQQQQQSANNHKQQSQAPIVVVQVWHDDEAELMAAAAAAAAAAGTAHPPAASKPSTCSSLPSSAALARLHTSSHLEAVMRKNLRSCLGTLSCTVLVLGEVCVAHWVRHDVLLKLMWPLGLLDMAITAAAIAHLMHNAHSGGSAGATHAKDARVRPLPVASPTHGPDASPNSSPPPRRHPDENAAHEARSSMHVRHGSLPDSSDPAHTHTAPRPYDGRRDSGPILLVVSPFITPRPTPSFAPAHSFASDAEMPTLRSFESAPAVAGAVSARTGTPPHEHAAAAAAPVAPPTRALPSVRSAMALAPPKHALATRVSISELMFISVSASCNSPAEAAAAGDADVHLAAADAAADTRTAASSSPLPERTQLPGQTHSPNATPPAAAQSVHHQYE